MSSRLSLQSVAPGNYLQACEIVDVDHPAIQAQAAALRIPGEDSINTVRRCFEFVRDEIAHSWDAQRGPVTLKASEALLAGVGYCYAKSHLLAALLRANGVPAGLCYQRLSVGNGGAPYCLHGLNAVYLPELGWYRIDARGNRADVHATFSPPQEQLAFPTREAAECDFPTIHVSPLPVVVEALRAHTDIFALAAALPDMEPNETLTESCNEPK